MFTFEMYKSSITTTTGVAQVTSLYNGMVPTLNNGFQVPPQLRKLGLVAAYSTHMTRVRMQAPSMQPWPYPDLSPANRGSAFESPARVFDFMANPFNLNPTEELDAFANVGSNTETAYVGVQFTDGVYIPPPAGRFFTVHATAAVTLTAGGWTTVAPVFDLALPAMTAGPQTYALLGARYYSATAAFFQMLPAQQPNWRPGGVGVQAYDQLDPPGQRAYGWFSGGYQSWGVWLTFQQNVPPAFNCFATSADTAEEFWLDLVAIGAP
jgi:hypothetical protein